MSVTSNTNNGKDQGFPWPAEFADHRQDVEIQWNVSALHLHKERAGKSGALVYLAHVNSAAYCG